MLENLAISDMSQGGKAMILSSYKSSYYILPMVDGRMIWCLENDESPSALLGTDLRVKKMEMCGQNVYTL